MLKNSLRQIFRTKIKSCLFFVLITVCALLICLGCNLVKQCQQNIKKFKEVFTTIGTVEQKPIAYTKRAMYDAGTKAYTYYTAKEYGKVFSLSELDMKGVNYLSGPERRAYYSCYLPDYHIRDERWGPSNNIIIEASPLEDCVPNGPVKMKITKFRYGTYEVNTDLFKFCDHFNDHPEKMYKDKTYIMCLTDALSHEYRMGYADTISFERIPNGGPYSQQTTADGTLLPSVLPEVSYEEMDEKYYEEGHDRYWDAYANELEMMLHNVPVTATEDLNLMMAFYNNDATIKDGELLEKEDFANGNAVCLISDIFARRNGIKIGDHITLPLRVADYALPSIIDWNCFPLNAQGDNFQVFFTGDYTVKGIYVLLPGGGTDRGYTLDENEIIIPRKSVKADDSNNIGIYGDHISPYNTSFQIPNGTIDEFMKQWEAKGIENVTIHFYDKGYSKLMDGIQQMEHMAVLLLAAGIVMTVLVLLFFSSMMIGGQKRRTAIERSLGASKAECIRSILTGLLLIAAVGCILGCLVGGLLTQGVSSAMSNQQIFDRTYSAGVVYSKIEVEQPMSGDILVSLAAFVGVFGFTVMAAGISAWRNLKEEPLALLSRK